MQFDLQIPHGAGLQQVQGCVSHLRGFILAGVEGRRGGAGKGLAAGQGDGDIPGIGLHLAELPGGLDGQIDHRRILYISQQLFELAVGQVKPPGLGGIEETEQFGVNFRLARMPGEGQDILPANG